jgi:hypothetical protein
VSWITAFKVIPWKDLIDSAPVIVRGARKLWGLVGKNATEPKPQAASGPEGRVEALEREVANLQEQAAKSAKLISELAIHSERLVDAVEILRLRTKVLMIAVSALVALCAAIGVFVIFR